MIDLEQIAEAVAPSADESKTSTTTKAYHVYGWPPVMTTALGAAYIGGSKWTLCRAHRAGLIKPIGRRGRTHLWRREDLDDLMLGAPAKIETTIKPTKPIARTSASSSAQLARLARITKGAR